MKVEIRLVLLAVIAAIAMGGMPLRACAQADGGQGDVSNQVIASLDLEDVDVRDAIRALFKNVNANYVVAPEVQGTVTVQLKNVKFEVALRNILDQVKATYRIEGGIFNIIKRDETVVDNTNPTAPILPTASKTPVRIYINHADPLFIIMMLGSRQTTAIKFPEYSTLINGSMFGGSNGGGFGGSGGGGLGGGRGGFGGGGGGLGGGGYGGGQQLRRRRLRRRKQLRRRRLWWRRFRRRRRRRLRSRLDSSPDSDYHSIGDSNPDSPDGSPIFLC